MADELVRAGVDLIGVRGGVQVHDRGGDRPWADQLHRVEARGQDQVGAGQQVPDDPVTRHVEHAGKIRVVLRKHPLGHRRDHHREAGQLREAEQFRTRGAAERGDARQDHRATRGAQDPQRVAVAVHVDRSRRRGQRRRGQRRRADSAAGPVPGGERAGGDGPGIGGHGQVDGAGALGDGRPQRLTNDDVRRGRIQAQRQLGNRGEQPVVIDHLVGEELLAGTLDLAGDRQHRHPVQGRRGHAVQHRRRPRAQGGQAGSGRAGHHRGRLGHEGGRALPHRGHHLDAAVACRLHEIDDGFAGIAEDVPHADRVQVAGQPGRRGLFGRRRARNR